LTLSVAHVFVEKQCKRERERERENERGP